MAAVTGTVYLLHFDRPFGHARHYTGNPASSRFLKVQCAVAGCKLPELSAAAGR
jgi:hypothetical protein